MAGAPDDLGGGLAFLDAPPAPFVPAPLHGAPLIAIAVLWTGAPDDAAVALEALRALAPPIDGVRPMPYLALQGMFERPAQVQAPTRASADGGFFADLPADTVAAAARVAAAGRELAPWACGETYPNFIGAVDPARLRAAYGPATFARLPAIRAEWDPGNVLAAGQAIPLR